MNEKTFCTNGVNDCNNDPKVDEEDYNNAKGKMALPLTVDDYKSSAVIIHHFRIQNPTSKDKACSSLSMPRCKEWLC